jgi:hypothetical protein
MEEQKYLFHVKPYSEVSSTVASFDKDGVKTSLSPSKESQTAFSTLFATWDRRVVSISYSFGRILF